MDWLSRIFDWLREQEAGFSALAAIDRIVHHSVITEFDVPSYRTAEAQEKAKRPATQGRRASKKSSRT